MEGEKDSECYRCAATVNFDKSDNKHKSFDSVRFRTQVACSLPCANVFKELIKNITEWLLSHRHLEVIQQIGFSTKFANFSMAITSVW